MQKITRNTFPKGLNTDLESGKLPPEQYTDAHNIELVGDGSFLAAKNIKGTTNVDLLSGADGIEVIGVFENKYKIQGTSKKCLTIFTMEDFNLLEADPVTYVFTGLDAGLSKSIGSVTMPAASGTYTFTGTSNAFSVVTKYLIKGTQTTKANACSLVSLGSGATTVYCSNPNPAAFVVGTTQLFTDVGLTTPFLGSGVGAFFKFAKSTGGTEYGVEVSPGGIILSIAAC